MIGHNYADKKDKDEEEVRNEHEERERNIMKEILKEKHLKHRQFVEKLKKKEEEIKQQEENIPSNSAYIDRRFHSSKIKAKIQNERMKNLLTKVDVYLKRIDIDSVEILKLQAEKEFEKEKSKKIVGKEEMQKILTRLNKLNKKDEIEKDNNKTKIQLREKSKNRTTNGNLRPSSTTKLKETRIIPNKVMNIEKNLLFQLEDSLIGTNAMPDQTYQEEPREFNEGKEASKQVRRIFSAKSSTSIKSIAHVDTLPKINEKTKAESELRKILKQGNNLQSLMQFKRQYKWFDIAPYIHKAQVDMIKTKSVVKRGKSAFKQSNIDKLTRDAGDKLNYNNNREYDQADVENTKISTRISNLCNSYLNSCIYNITEYIQLHLLSSKDDDDILDKINQKDEFNRKGIFYLIYHRNYPMIKVTLSSGLVLSDCVDIYGRNLLHYCAMVDNFEIMEVLCRCFVLEYKEDFDGMKKFLLKSFVNKTSEEQTENIDVDESILKEILIKMENNIANKIDVEYLDENAQRHTVIKSKNKNFDCNGNDKKEIINTLEPTIITHNKYFYFDEIKRLKMPLSRVINQEDMDGKTAIFFAAENDNLDMIKCLAFYNAKTDLKDCHDKRPIDYATSDIIHKFLLSHTKTSQQKLNNADKTLNLNKETASSKTDEKNQNEILQIRNLKYIPEEKISKLSLGYEHNSYLINSIIQDNYESFCYLLTSKNADIRLRNSNGWNALHFIISQRKYKYLSYLFLSEWNNDEVNNNLNIVCGNVSEIKNDSGGNDNYSEIDRIYDSLLFKEYSANDIFDAKGHFNILGNSFAILDVLTNNQLNILFMSFDIKNKKESFILFKIICLLLMKREALQASGIFSKEKISPFGIILNRKYDKSEKPLLLKAIESKNFEAVDYLINKIKGDYCNLYFSTTEKEKKNLYEKIQVNLYETDKTGGNALHYSVKYSKDPKFIKFFVKIDAEKNILRSMEDSAHKLAQDYDSSKQLIKYFTHIWDAARLNDHILIEKILSEDPDTSLNEQCILVRNTPLHIAAMNCADKVSLYLISNNAQIDVKNSKKQTALDIAVEQAKTSDSAKLFLRKFKAILNKEIIDFMQLESYNRATTGNSLIMNSSFASVKNNAINKKVSDILRRIKVQIIERKLNFKKIFDIVDDNKNGKLEGHEFESLFTVLDIQGISRDDILLMMSYIDTNRNGMIEYGEFIKALENE